MSASKLQLTYLFPYSLTAFDAEKFGFDALRKNGVELRVLDLSRLVSTRNDNGANFLTHDYIHQITSYAALEKEILAQRSAIFIDNINGINGFQWQSRRIFKLFKRYNVNYCVVEVGALPIFTPLTPKNLLNKLKNSLNLSRLKAYLQWRLGRFIVYYQWKWFASYQLPATVFIGNSASKERYVERYQLSPEQIIPIHSFDYDRYLAYCRSTPAPLFPGKKIAVFLDQMLATHCDFGKSISVSPVTTKKYLPALNRFFARIEKELGLEVVIAASPRADYQNQPIFGNRKIVTGKTLECVAESELVLFHSSTAISFATLFDKPVLLIKTQEMSQALGYANFLHNMADSLHLSPLNIDDSTAVNQFDYDHYRTWPKNYDDYQYQYVMSKNAPAMSTWEIVISALQSISEQHKEVEYV